MTLAAFAQQPAQKEAPAVLRVTTRLVEVSVIVQEKNGNPVTDLEKSDFTLLEQGKPQLISTFALESSRALTRSAAALPPNTYTNRLEQRMEAPTSISVILLDGLNTRIEDQSFARQNIIKFLEQIQPQDRVAIYLLGHGQIRVLHDFSGNSATLIAALKRYRGRLGHEVGASESEPTETGVAELDEFLQEANQRMVNFYLTDRAINTANALEAVAGHLARFPGRKNLIWVSASFPIAYGLDAQPTRNNLSPERRTFYAETDKAARALSNANVAVYPVDARGLMGAFPNPNFNRMGSQTGRSAPRPMLTTLNDLGSNIDTMQILADKTGGKAYYNRNDIDGAVRSAIEDSRVSYVLGYYPTHGRWDGRFVPLNVKVNRPGLRVRFRKGYYAGTETKLAVQELMAILHDAARSPLESTSLGLTAHIEEVPNAPVRSLKVSMNIDRRDINLVREDDRWIGALDFLYSQRNQQGQVVSSTATNLGMRLKPDTHDQIEEAGIVFAYTIPVDPNAYLLRVVVRDARSGAIGTVSIPLKAAADKTAH
ncbi:MAG TPA: VWA domain-containing protein [Candidatus Acidoferrales bacterium]|nr:VWA domain-containing protein [Candidatus Acidoferrales bacterium]